MSNIYYWEKLTFSKLVEKVNFSERKFEEITSFEEQNGTRYIRGNVYFGITVFSCLSSTKLYLRSQISFNLFCSGDKRLLSEFLTKWRWCQGHKERFPKWLGNIKISKNWDLSLETLVAFWLWKKRPENAFLTLTVNYRKIVQKSKLCYSKQQ